MQNVRPDEREINKSERIDQHNNSGRKSSRKEIRNDQISKKENASPQLND